MVFAPLQPPAGVLLAVQLVALVDDQVSVEVLPLRTGVEALRVTVGAGGPITVNVPLQSTVTGS